MARGGHSDIVLSISDECPLVTARLFTRIARPNLLAALQRASMARLMLMQRSGPATCRQSVKTEQTRSSGQGPLGLGGRP